MTSSPEPLRERTAQEVSATAFRRWWLILLVALMGAGVSYGVTQLAATSYSASVTLVVQLPSGGSDTEALVRTVEALTTSRILLADLARNSGSGLTPGQVEDRLVIMRPAGSAVIEVSVVDTKAARARSIAEEVVPALKGRLQESRSESSDGSVSIGVRSFAGGPQVEQVEPPGLRDGVLGGAAGAALGLLVAIGWPQRRNFRGV